MGVYKRGEVWWYGFTTPNGRRVQRSAETTDRKAAQELHDRLKYEAWRTERLGDKPRRTWKEAVVLWLKEMTHKRTLEKDRETFRWLDKYLGNMLLDQIDRELLRRILEAKKNESSESTANRNMALVKAVLRRARDEWQWIVQVPKVPMYIVENERIRFLTREEAERVLSFLPPHQQQLMRFELATGLRQRNNCLLEWAWVDMKRRCAAIPAGRTKNRKAIPVPLNADAMAVLEAQVGKHEKYVFVYKGKPQWQVNTKAWRRALVKAGITDYRRHDNRHTWASWHIQGGTPLHVLKELGGWKTFAMVQRYAHLTSDHLAPHAERVVRTPVSEAAPARVVAEPATNLLQPVNPKVVQFSKYLK